MTTVEFLSKLRNLGVELHADGEQLRLSAPQGVLTPSLQEELKARKNEILAFLKQLNVGDPAESNIPHYSRQGYLPLSFSQERLWILDQLEPCSPAYNLPAALRLRGPLNLTCVQRALDTILSRHEVLRTSFDMIDQRPTQIIAAAQSLPLTIIDLSAFSEEEQNAQAKRLSEEEARRPFNLQKDLPIRASLLKLNDEEHVFLLTMHHIASDAWSIAVFAREFASLYTAFLKGQADPLPPLPIQYADFSQWQREWLQGDRLETQLAYWKRQLQGELPQLDMLLDRPRPAVQSHQSGRATFDLSASLTQALRHLSREEDATLFMTLLAAFKLLLHKHTGLEDIVIGSPIAGRTRTETEDMIGFFLNTLVLRTDLSGNPDFRELVQRVRKVAADAYSHQDIPFEKLLIELQPERDLSRTPFFQVLFNMLNIEESSQHLPGLTVEIFEAPDIGSKFDLTLYVRELSEGIRFILVFSKDLFDLPRIQELLAQWEHLLVQIAANPSRKIAEYSLAIAGQTRQKQADIIKRLSMIANDFHEFTREEINQSITNRFEKQAASLPNRIAVKTMQHEWTYQHLNQIANSIAHAVLNTFGKEERIALLFDHDAPMIAGILGILKAGKAYIPLDPHYPQQRLGYMLTDSETNVIVTNNAQVALAQSLAGNTKQLINIDALSVERMDVNPRLNIPPQTLAYILYTSGSTGQPKGVMQSHGNVLHFMQVYTNNLHIGATDRLSLLSSYSFDAAVMDIFGALLNGATLYPIDLRKDGFLGLARYLNENQITIYHSTPTVYRYFLNSLNESERFPSLRLVVLGGEAVVKQDVELYKKHFLADCVMVNGLGPTESTVTLQYFIDKETKITRNAVPVGYPVTGTEVIFLNEQGKEVPGSGEVAIRSPYIALGYWNKPHITESAFLSDRELGGKRIYRTGDVGVRLPDETIEFRGRKDFQVKIRGHRVEVGEVEFHLAKHPGIKECVVIADNSSSGETHLVAYFVSTGTQPTGNEIRNFLEDKLPDFMIPSIFLPLQSLPMTPTGKIDRLSLPTPDYTGQLNPNQRVNARNPVEEELIKIWEDVLHVQPIGVRDNFFELGGHSLMAVHLFTRINQTFNVNLPLATLFRDATVEHLANAINRDTNSEKRWSALIAVKPEGNHLPFFCVHGLTGDILWFRDLADCLSPDYPFYGLQSRGLDGIQAPLTSIEDMAAYYISEIRRLQPKGPYYLGGASFGGAVALEIAQQLLAQQEQVALLAIFDHVLPNVSTGRTDGKLKAQVVVAYRILRNLPRWLKEFSRMGRFGMAQRIRRKLRVAQKAATKKDPSDGIAQFDAEDLIDFAAELSPHRQRLISYNYQALRRYVPQPYAGHVSLFRASHRPLFSPHDPEAGWQKLAPGRVHVFDVPSSHEGMFRQPYVQDLASKLKSYWDDIHA